MPPLVVVIVDVPQLSVNPVPENTHEVPVTVMDAAPSVNDRVEVPVDESVLSDTVWPFISSAPAVCDNELDPAKVTPD